MKKLFLGVIAFVMFFSIFISSCKKTGEEILANSESNLPITSQSAANQIKYAETNR
jgi:hypothetical protein